VPIDRLDAEVIQQFLDEVGNRHGSPARLHLIGGSALFLLGHTRPTLDIDYVGSDLHKSKLQHTIDLVADKMQLDVDAVPLGEFVPIPPDAADRHRLVGRFGSLEVYIFDPYTIALSKIARGFDTDIDDVAYLLRSRAVELGRLSALVHETLARAQGFDLSALEMRQHLEAVLARADLDTTEGDC
jgi:hypothetical protein